MENHITIASGTALLRILVAISPCVDGNSPKLKLIKVRKINPPAIIVALICKMSLSSKSNYLDL
jgi:hypothetical protein